MGRTKQPPGSSAKMWVTLIALILGSQSLWAAEPEIACRQILQQAITVTVMGADGSNPTVIFKGDKFKRGSTMPQWSPGGEWIAFRRVTNPEVDQVSGIYKIRPGGEEMTQILCAAGTAPGNTSFRSPYYPQWSPDGEWILVLLSRLEGDMGAENWLGVVQADETPEDCYSNLVHLYAPEYDPATGDGWNIVYGSPTWTDDGSKIAFFEEYQFEDSPSDYRLQVLDVDDSGQVPTVVATHLIDLPDDLHQVMIWTGLDWQRDGGNILLFDTNDGIDKVTWLDLDLENYVIRSWEHLTNGWNARWSPHNNRMVYNSGYELRVANIEYDTEGTPAYTDSSIIFPDQSSRSCLWPDWKRDTLQASCTTGGDCEDGNPCTDNVCNGGVCETSDNTADCDDGNPCTFGDVCGGGFCRGTSFDGSDSGCDGWCCDGDCWEGANSCEPPVCAPRGEPCILNEECCSGSCHPRKGTCK